MTSADLTHMATANSDATAPTPATTSTVRPSRQAHALAAVADLVTATALPGLSITIYGTGRISIQIPDSSVPLSERITRLRAVAAAFDTVTVPPATADLATGPNPMIFIEADGTLAGHPVTVFTAIDHAGHAGERHEHQETP
jgi:hypothetical protein